MATRSTDDLSGKDSSRQISDDGATEQDSIQSQELARSVSKEEATIIATMSQSGLDATVILDGRNQQSSGDKPMKTFKRVLRNTILRGEFIGELILLVVGRTGQGKSSLINSICELEEQIAKECATTDNGTKSLQPYTYSDVIPGVTVKLVDTPGLQDTKSNEQTYIQQIKEHCPQVHLVLYCMKITDQRIQNDDKVAIQKLYDTFGSKFWERVIFVLTKANNERVDVSDERDEGIPDIPRSDREGRKEMKKRRFENRVSLRVKWTKTFLFEQVGFDKALVNNMSFVPAGYYVEDDLIPDPYVLHGTPWLYNLLKKSCEEIKTRHRFSKLNLNDTIIIDNSIENEELKSLNDQAKEMKDALEKLGFFVLYFNYLTSHCISQLLEAFQHVDYSQISTFALIILSKGDNSRHIHGTDNEPVPFEAIFSTFKDKSLLDKITKLFFFHMTHEGQPVANRLDFKITIPENSIALAVSFNQEKGMHMSPAVSSFIANLRYENQQLKRCFELMKDQCDKLPAAECEYQSTLKDNYVLPCPNYNEDVISTEKEVDICRTMWYKIRCKTIDVLLKNKSTVMSIVRKERITKIVFSVTNIAGGGLVVGGLFMAPFTFGASLSLSAIGGVTTGVGALGNFSAHIYSHIRSNKCLHKAQSHIKMDQQLSFCLNELVKKYNQAVEAHKLTVFVSSVQAAAGAVGATRFGMLLAKRAAEEGLIAAKTAGRIFGFTIAAVTIPVDIGLVIYNCYLLYNSDSDGSTDSNKAITELYNQIQDSLKGFYTVINEREIPKLQKVFTDCDCGYTIQKSLSIKEDQPTVTVSTILSGPFAFPSGNILVSAIYDVKIDKKLEEPITMEIEHCVDVTKPSEVAKMSFAIGTAKVNDKVFEFISLEDGVFPMNEPYGSIKLKGSSLLCILYSDPKSLQINYAAQCSYTEGDRNFWKLKCRFSKYLNAHIRFARQYGDTEIYPFKFTTPTALFMGLDVFKGEIKTANLWSISPKSVPKEISKVKLDVIELSSLEKLLNQVIPYLELDIVRTDEATSNDLKYNIQVPETTLNLLIACKTKQDGDVDS